MALGFTTIMLFIHVLSVVGWFASFPIYWVISRQIKLAADMGSIVSVLRPVGNLVIISQVLVFVTGGAMVGADWFQFSPSAWLAIKQIIFFVVVGVSHALVLSSNRKVGKLVADNAKPKEISSQFSKTLQFSLISVVFLVLNVFLATTKPF